VRSLVYLALRRVLELVVLLGRSGERKEVEILVLRHDFRPLSANSGVFLPSDVDTKVVPATSHRFDY
jgi:hypothetical protein